MKKILVGFMVLLMSLTSCQGIPTTTLDGLMAVLKAEGYDGTWSKAEPSFFAGERLISKLDSEEMLQIYSYPDEAAMNLDAAGISADGSGYRSPTQAVEIDWVDRPHFYRKDNLIILYVGRDRRVLDLLDAFAGSPFAGSGS